MNALWVELYRPRGVSELILPERIISVINNFIKTGDVPNMLFYGRAGTCKTTTAKAIINTIDAECLFINGSDETGKADVSNKVVPFATGMNLSDTAKQRVVIIDECDRLSAYSQDYLKAFIEEHSGNCRFIFTCNTPSKIIEPLKSRCLCFDFNVSGKEKPQLMTQLMARIINILNERGIQYEQKALIHLIYNLFPDYRKIINQLQSYITAYGKVDEGLLAVSSNDIASEVYSVLKSKKFDEIRKWVVETEYDAQDIISALYAGLQEHVPAKSIPNSVLVLAEYDYKHAFVTNPQLNILACCLEISSLL